MEKKLVDLDRAYSEKAKEVEAAKGTERYGKLLLELQAIAMQRTGHLTFVTVR